MLNKAQIEEASSMSFSAQPAEFDQKAVSDMSSMLDLFRGDSPTVDYSPPVVDNFANTGMANELNQFNNAPVMMNEYGMPVQQAPAYAPQKQMLVENPIPAGAKFDPMTGEPLTPQWKFDPITGKPVGEVEAPTPEPEVIKESTSTGEWLLTRKNFKDGTSTYSVKHDESQSYIIENMECKEAAWCVMKLLNEGKTINQHPICEILEEERKFSSAKSTMIFIEGRIAQMNQTGEKSTMMESKLTHKQDQYESAHNQIKKYKQELFKLK